jgi:hypothetical protein
VPRSGLAKPSTAAGHVTCEAARLVYARLPVIDFSQDVLQLRPSDLAVLPVSGLEWNDLGNRERVLSTRERRHRQLTSALS